MSLFSTIFAGTPAYVGQADAKSKPASAGDVRSTLERMLSLFPAPPSYDMPAGASAVATTGASAPSSAPVAPGAAEPGAADGRLVRFEVHLPGRFTLSGTISAKCLERLLEDTGHALMGLAASEPAILPER